MSDSSDISGDEPGDGPDRAPAVSTLRKAGGGQDGEAKAEHMDDIVHPAPDISPSAEPDMSNVMDSRDILQLRLAELRRRHRELDDEISIAMSRTGSADALEIRRLKKRKLALKDQIAKVEDQLMPDIIA